MSCVEGVIVIGNCTDPITASAAPRNIYVDRAGHLTLEKITSDHTLPCGVLYARTSFSPWLCGHAVLLSKVEGVFYFHNLLEHAHTKVIA